MTQSIPAPSFGPYNTLMCRPGKIASFPLSGSIYNDGLIVAMDFYPYADGPSTQTIFSLRNTATNFISLRVDYFLSSGALNLWINPSGGSPYYVAGSSIISPISIDPGKSKHFKAFKIINVVLKKNVGPAWS